MEERIERCKDDRKEKEKEVWKKGQNCARMTERKKRRKNGKKDRTVQG